jgi:hypothetical protein
LNSHARASRRTTALITLLGALLVITGTLVAVEISASSPTLIAIGVIGWMLAVMGAVAWTVSILVRIVKTLVDLSERDREHREQLSEDARKHREELNDRLQHELCAWVYAWLRAQGEQVQQVERTLGALAKQPDTPADELAERRAAR